MSFEKIREIPSPREIAEQIPMSQEIKKMKEERDLQIKNIFEKKDDKFLVVIGPCSAHDENALCEYVTRLAKVQEKTKDKLMLIPRIYTNKPRTNGSGYKGMLHQPNPNEEPNMGDGIITIRKMHLKAMKESGLTAADEMLYTNNLDYVSDLLSYIAIGARSVENQQHRLTSSGIDIPVGMKNPTSGDLSIMFNSIFAAQNKHSFIYNRYEVKSSGNPLSHGILRGYVNKNGNSQSNYHYEDLMFTIGKYKEQNLENPLLIIDTNHSNSDKKFKEQIRISKEILNSRKYNSDIKDFVGGLMIESYLEEGTQPVEGTTFGKSITDPCLGWDDTEKLLYYIAENC